MAEHHHLDVIILAAGQGTRMRSTMPKVLHPVAGKPMLGHVIDTAKKLCPSGIHVVYGHGGEQVRSCFNDEQINWVEQAEQLGTGHAVAQAMPQIESNRLVLILYGDVPLIKADTLAELVRIAERGVGLLTVHLDNPAGYGRIVREHGEVSRIVEEKDADAEVKLIKEVNTGILALPADHLKNYIERLDNNNAQNEYYLTDIIAMAVAQGVKVEGVHPGSEFEVSGVNSRQQLAVLEREYQAGQAKELMSKGVTLLDYTRIDVRGEIDVAQDITIDANVVLEGSIQIGRGVRIGSNCVIKNSIIEDDVEILPMCVIEDAVVGKGSRVGPFARLRPGACLGGDNHIGNFVEIKNSEIGPGSKVNHLSYIGDTSMGSGVNIGAGTITANYDGANKHRTTIEDNASTGSNSVLVAPVKVGKSATLGAGTVLTSDAPEGELTITRVKQKSVRGWKRPVKKSD